jgi:hypothetical protein
MKFQYVFRLNLNIPHEFSEDVWITLVLNPTPLKKMYNFSGIL